MKRINNNKNNESREKLRERLKSKFESKQTWADLLPSSSLLDAHPPPPPIRYLPLPPTPLAGPHLLVPHSVRRRAPANPHITEGNLRRLIPYKEQETFAYVAMAIAKRRAEGCYTADFLLRMLSKWFVMLPEGDVLLKIFSCDTARSSLVQESPWWLRNQMRQWMLATETPTARVSFGDQLAIDVFLLMALAYQRANPVARLRNPQKRWKRMQAKITESLAQQMILSNNDDASTESQASRPAGSAPRINVRSFVAMRNRSNGEDADGGGGEGGERGDRDAPVLCVVCEDTSSPYPRALVSVTPLTGAGSEHLDMDAETEASLHAVLDDFVAKTAMADSAQKAGWRPRAFKRARPNDSG
jgi:hypothetical protein